MICSFLINPQYNVFLDGFQDQYRWHTQHMKCAVTCHCYESAQWNIKAVSKTHTIAETVVQPGIRREKENMIYLLSVSKQKKKQKKNKAPFDSSL